ncbi:MAG TPA: glycosyltransferase family 4 protein [Gemmatimonadaceae bacterium]|nr:glycosyltransferase family 4 protein [Gemmatimonadaceae bacterium]
MSVRRVLFVAHNFPRTGGDAAGGFLLDLALALATIDIAVEVIAPHARGLPERDIVNGIHVQRVRYGDDADETLAYTGTMAEQVKASTRGKRAMLRLIGALRRGTRHRLASGDIDVVHAHWWFPSALAIGRTAVRSRVPMVVTSHGSDARMATGVTASLASFALGRAAAVTTVSQWLAQRLHPLTAAPITVAPMPADIARFTAAAAIRSTPPRLLFVGRLNAQKNPALLLRVLAELPDAVHLDVVGDGPDASALHAQGAQLGIAHRVAWHGQQPRDAMPAFYAQASCTLVPSREEGFGMVAAESMLCETPVIATDSGGLPDIVRDGENGRLLTSHDDPAPWTAAIRELALDATRRAAVGAVARTSMIALVSPAAVAARYRDVYEAARRGIVRAR